MPYTATINFDLLDQDGSPSSEDPDFLNEVIEEAIHEAYFPNNTIPTNINVETEERG